jgi:hypothetical protein
MKAKTFAILATIILTFDVLGKAVRFKNKELSVKITRKR